MPAPFLSASPCLALAPMQDITDLPFWGLMARYGGADLYYTEYFRVHPNSRLDPRILSSLTENPTGKPAIAQLLGNDPAALAAAARELAHYPIAAVDLNLGCPAPVVYRKCAGGGLLREPERVEAILGALRESIAGPFTVKTRLGFEETVHFETLLHLFRKHSVDLVTVHARTVKELYTGEVRYDFIARAVAELPCPVLANGNIHSAAQARRVLEQTGARGLMIGRGAIRNPWLFAQIRAGMRGEAGPRPCGHEVLAYVRALYEAVCTPGVRESSQVQKMKKYLNFIGAGVEPTGAFLHAIRRVGTREEFFQVCETFLAHEEPMALEPFAKEAPEAVLG